VGMDFGDWERGTWKDGEYSSVKGPVDQLDVDRVIEYGLGDEKRGS